jgi:cytochrome d ubiquinol oxidase subunit I
VEDAATANTGIWITFVLVIILYAALGVTAVMVLRGMSRRYRRSDTTAEADGFDEADVPYGPSEATDDEPTDDEVPVG